jgi:hypothetical protein
MSLAPSSWTASARAPISVYGLSAETHYRKGLAAGSDLDQAFEEFSDAIRVDANFTLA